jgi:hypothetical protein
MIPISDFIRLLKIENELIHQQTEGLSQADTLIQPQPTGNCMNWVLGHLLDTQVEMLSILREARVGSDPELKRYTRGSAPITTESGGILSLADLICGLDDTHGEIVKRLEEMNEVDFEQEIRIGERVRQRGWQVFFLHFHYTYHIGQLEQLRQLAGHSEQII